MKKVFIAMLVPLMFVLTSCEGYTWKYRTTVQYHYAGESQVHTTYHDFVVSYNSTVEEISVQAYANSFNNGHYVELVYCVQHGGVIQENRTGSGSYFKYNIMQVPDKSVVIDNVETVCVSKTE